MKNYHENEAILENMNLDEELLYYKQGKDLSVKCNEELMLDEVKLKINKSD